MMRKCSLWTLAAFVFCPLPSLAGTRIEQSVNVSSGSTTHTNQHVWHIEDDKFDLVIRSQGDTTERKFIFNGRIMYLCGRPDTDQLKNVFDLSTADPTLLKKLESGVCQEVPNNFLVRFFLSPVAATHSIDLTDGLKLTLEIDDFQLIKKDARKIANQDTQGFTRSFQITKSGLNRNLKQTVSESFYAGGSERTRSAMWNELSKNLLRQPKGIQLRKHLKTDFELNKGLMIEGEATFESSLNGGSKTVGTVAAKTTKIENASFPSSRFRIPTGYTVISPENIQTLAASQSKTTQKTETKTKNQDSELLDKVQSVFFCAISGSLFCVNK